MNQPHAPRKTAQTHSRRRLRPQVLLAITPIVLGLAVSGCETIEETSDYVGDLFSYIENDDEIFSADAVPGADEPYRSLHEVPGEAPAVASADERDAVAAGLVADREKAQHTAAAIRTGDSASDGQIRAVYLPARKNGDASPPDGA